MIYRKPEIRSFTLILLVPKLTWWWALWYQSHWPYGISCAIAFVYPPGNILNRDSTHNSLKMTKSTELPMNDQSYTADCSWHPPYLVLYTSPPITTMIGLITCYKRKQVTYTRKRCCPILVDLRRPIYLHASQTYVQLCFNNLAFKKHHKHSNHIFWTYVLYQVLIPRRTRQPICVCKCTLCHYKMVIQAPQLCTFILKSLQFLNLEHYKVVPNQLPSKNLKAFISLAGVLKKKPNLCFFLNLQRSFSELSNGLMQWICRHEARCIGRA